MRVAILDDVERVALDCADWRSLGAVEVVALERHVDSVVELGDLLRGFDVLVVQRERTRVSAALLDALPALRLVVTTGVRNASIDLEACAARGVVVCSTGGTQAPVVEHAWALILAALRDVPGRDTSMRLGEWQPTAGRALEGRTLGLLGLGRTGTRMARIAAAFGMETIAWSENLTAAVAEERGARRVEKDELFSASDVLSVHQMLSPRSRGLVGERELSLMRPDAWLVNTSRGPVVDETALVSALRAGWIAGAALDVYDDEPLPADHPLRSLPNTVLTPHVGYVTLDNYRDWYTTAVSRIAAWADGRPESILAP
ncbi:MAG TPA: D-2-hydroxyacid dehydrogenase family protein [Candidatus Nanopelagicales bacterium]|nr:D-2-hydroxyacid dehydrogenase family protein [Candidatus Nanopelagicales bacterium]